MELFKIENYKRDHPKAPLPPVEQLSKSKVQDLRDQIRARLGMVSRGDALTLVQQIAETAMHLDGVDAQESGFSFSELLQRLNIRAHPRVYINWYRFDQIDTLPLSDLSRCFDYIWYPGVDDIDIFDDSCTWIVSVSHSGDVSFLVLDPGT